MSKQDRKPLLEESLLTALKAIDNQVARAMERTPAEREVSGVQKWKPFDDKIEQVSTLILDNFGEGISLDGVLVMSQAMVKALSILSSELGSEGLGDLRTSYVKEALQLLSIEIERAKNIFKEDAPSLQ